MFQSALAKGVCSSLAAAALAVTAFTGPALAQGAQDDVPAEIWDEMYCVYDSISAENLLTLVSFYFEIGDVEEEVVNDIYGAAHAGCGSEYGWNDELHTRAEEIAIMAAVIKVVGAEVTGRGLRNIGAVMVMHESLTDGEYDSFYDGSWADDEPLIARLHTELKAAGVPDDGVVLDLSLALVEANVVSELATIGFLEERLQ